VNAVSPGVHEVDAGVSGDDVNKHNWIIRIVAVPPGEAPLWVREKWIGLDLPVARYFGHGRFLTMGVLWLPRSVLAQWLAVFRGSAERIAGYAVEALPAVDILARAHPEAAAWWRENTPHLIAPKRYLVFHEEVYRIADI
jgi:hypothetical protein